MLDTVKQNLTFDLPQVTSAFGGAEAFINLLLDRYDQDHQIDQYLYKLLSASQVEVLSPVNPFFLLYQNDGNLEDILLTNSIIFQEPYSVYSDQGELLYRVSNHNGIFGNSILDRALLLQSQNTSLYYLHYKTYEGEKVVLIMINLNASSNRKINAGLDLINTSSPVRLAETFNSLSFKLTDAYRDSSSKPYPITLYFLTASGTIPIKESIPSSSAYRDSYSINVGDSFIFYPQSSGWLVLTQNTPAGIQFLQLNSTAGSGFDQLKQVSPYLYYLAIGSDPATRLMKRTLQIPDLTAPQIQIQANLTR